MRWWSPEEEDGTSTFSKPGHMTLWIAKIVTHVRLDSTRYQNQLPGNASLCSQLLKRGEGSTLFEHCIVQLYDVLDENDLSIDSVDYMLDFIRLQWYLGASVPGKSSRVQCTDDFSLITYNERYILLGLTKQFVFYLGPFVA